jgi:nitroreductase
METWDAIRSRRNVRQYEERPIPDGDLERIIEAGWRSPSASNRQHRDFVVVTERDRLGELSRVWQGAGHVAGSAATVVVVYPVSNDEHQQALDAFDQGQAVMQMMITAADLGVGSCHSAVGDQELLRSLLGYPESHASDMMVSFGYPADGPLRPVRQPNRRSMAEVVHRGHW